MPFHRHKLCSSRFIISFIWKIKNNFVKFVQSTDAAFKLFRPKKDKHNTNVQRRKLGYPFWWVPRKLFAYGWLLSEKYHFLERTFLRSLHSMQYGHSWITVSFGISWNWTPVGRQQRRRSGTLIYYIYMYLSNNQKIHTMSFDSAERQAP